MTRLNAVSMRSLTFRIYFCNNTTNDVSAVPYKTVSNVKYKLYMRVKYFSEKKNEIKSNKKEKNKTYTFIDSVVKKS